MRPQHLTLFAMLSFGCTGGPALAQDDAPFDRTPTSCLSLSRVDRTRVLDDQTILFFLRGKAVYRNYLPQRCPGLAQNDRFSYESTGGRLCSVDTVTVLEQWAGRLESGFTCRLGEFHPISPEEIEELEALLDGRKRREAVEATPVELPERPPSVDEPADAAPSPPAREGE